MCYPKFMIELLILYVIANREFTMYGIQKEIENFFGIYTRPSFGALNPALKRLETGGFLTSRKMMSDGGKLSVYYLATKQGLTELKKLLLEDMSANPLQFQSNAKIKLSCADILEKEKREDLFFTVKSKAMEFKKDAEKLLNNEYSKKNFYQKILLDNSICEYSNLITIIEGFEKDNARNG